MYIPRHGDAGSCLQNELPSRPAPTKMPVYKRAAAYQAAQDQVLLPAKAGPAHG